MQIWTCLSLLPSGQSSNTLAWHSLLWPGPCQAFQILPLLPELLLSLYPVIQPYEDFLLTKPPCCFHVFGPLPVRVLSSWNAFLHAVYQKKPYSCCKMQRKHWRALSSSLIRADSIPFTSQLSFVHPSPTVQGIARCAAIFCSLHLISTTSALQRQTYTYSFCMLKPHTVVKSKIVKCVN